MVKVIFAFIVICLIISCVSAFQVSNIRIHSKSPLSMSQEMVGASVEVNGGKVYDPLGLFVS